MISSTFRTVARGSTTTRRSICSSHLTIERTTDTTRFEQRPPKEHLQFGTTLSDHMLMIEWHQQQWSAPRIVPYQNLQLSPAASSLQYGLQCFEGMKAYKSLTDDSLRMFRPDKNMQRLANSMDRLQMPGADFDHDELLRCIAELIKIDAPWIPYGEGYSLYLRPTVIATTKALGLAAPDSILLYVITSPVGPYYKTGFQPIRLMTSTDYVRAWPGGTGNAKVGGNYAPTMKPQFLAAEHGCSQILWLFGENEEITEVGAMNVFFYLINDDTQRLELVTAPLTRGDILPGVTRDSILHLARSWGDFDVSERYVTMAEIEKAAKDGRLIEAFGAGTAAVVTPISSIRHKGKDIDISTETGELTRRIWNEITGIQYGKIAGPPGWSVKL
ncbi:branched-chain amino acid aminotransferase [Fistulifera solaris]|jgi:branched-chain amino acid aminotransferase|uniref:Branched-chain-amino-acid aminotransferase n=1 Tax=Fistulifera solaris TaxID=1519565 RepID=A0A1Z5JLS1_FISSO|nr:branched-chain amino acid aminotransferase [Fistulifera solaris]|eukprot:GAX14960.1 branched-chain amino acid aminotransferase [Fistulifera solaris]